MNIVNTPSIKNLNVAFFGTSDRSEPILSVLKQNFHLSLCVTKEDKPFGRNQTLKETGVKSWSKKNNIEYITVSDLKNENGENENCEKVINKLKEKKIELGIVADFSLIIPNDLINTPTYKLINIHFSLLPKYRGASPVQFSILNGDEKTGITYYLIGKGMDIGPILHQLQYELNQKETAGELNKTLFQIAAQNLPDVIEKYVKKELTPLPQDNLKATYTYSKSRSKRTFIYKEDAKINWSQPAEQIEREIRAYNPWPISWTTLGELDNEKTFIQEYVREKDKIVPVKIKPGKNQNLKVKIYRAKLAKLKGDKSILSDKSVLVIEKIQVEGGKVLTGKEFLNGYATSTAAGLTT